MLLNTNCNSLLTNNAIYTTGCQNKRSKRNDSTYLATVRTSKGFELLCRSWRSRYRRFGHRRRHLRQRAHAVVVAAAIRRRIEHARRRRRCARRIRVRLPRKVYSMTLSHLSQFESISATPARRPYCGDWRCRRRRLQQATRRAKTTRCRSTTRSVADSVADWAHRTLRRIWRLSLYKKKKKDAKMQSEPPVSRRFRRRQMHAITTTMRQHKLQPNK